MLVVNRVEDQDVMIDVPGWPTIVVRLVEVRGAQVKIGVEADPRVSVLRRELWSRDEESREKERRKGLARRERAADAARTPAGRG